MTALPALHRLLRAGTMLVACAVLIACGGGGSPEPGVGTPTPQPTPIAPADPPPAEPPVIAPSGAGEFRSATRLAAISRDAVAAALAAGGGKVDGVVPRYAVTAWRLTYQTVDGEGRAVVASGLVAVPDKPARRTSPVLSYQHGTIFRDAEAPSNALAAAEPPIVIASLGFIVVAPDYVGYGTTKGTPHPYLQSAPTAAAVNDLLTAARTWRSGTLGGAVPAGPAQGNGQLFLLGYSEGGYATVAAHRALQASTDHHHALHRGQLVASIAGAGPYHVGVTMDELLNRIKDENRALGALINPGFLRHLGGTVRDEVRRALVRELLPGDADVAFDTRVLDVFLADDIGTMERIANVHDWAPVLPLRMYHGRADRTVGYRAATVTLETMLAKGAAPALVTLTDCPAVPADHLPCVLPFFSAAMAYLATLATDL